MRIVKIQMAKRQQRGTSDERVIDGGGGEPTVAERPANVCHVAEMPAKHCS